MGFLTISRSGYMQIILLIFIKNMKNSSKEAIKCTKCTFSKIRYTQGFLEDIKIFLRGVDKEYFMIHNENVLNSVDKTLNSIHKHEGQNNESKWNKYI